MHSNIGYYLLGVYIILAASLSDIPYFRCGKYGKYAQQVELTPGDRLGR